MKKNQFLKKFKSKSDSELERIAMNSSSFVFDARFAAITILKNRKNTSPIIETVEEEHKKLKTTKKIQSENQKIQDRRLIRRIQHISIKGTGKYPLKNGNELQVKRLNENNFQVRIEDNFRSALGPVMICKIKDESTYICYPFLYLKPILIYGIGGTCLMFILILLGYIENEALIVFLPLFVTIGLQLLLMPAIHFVILHFFKDTLRKKI
jgi:hypothetical protein